MARGGTACCGFVIAIAMLCPAASPAQTPIDDAARLVTAGCPEAIRNAGQPQSFDAGMCLGIIEGLHYLSRDVCIPPATSLGEIADIVSRYVDSHGGKTNDDVRATSLEELRSAGPCGNRHDM